MAPCPLCRSADVGARGDLQRIIRSVYAGSSVMKCRRCGVGYLSPIPSAATIDETYRQSYFQAYRDKGIPMPAEAERPPERYLSRLTRAHTHGSQGRRLLDVGPGSGAFLRFARDSGWDVMGLETSQWAAESASARLALEIRRGTLLSSALPADSFDVVHMSHVLEHFADPPANMRQVHRILKPGGVVILELPNEFDSLQSRLLRAARLARPHSVPSTHIFFFNPSALRTLLLDCGFSVAHLSTVRDASGSPAIVALRRIVAAVERPLHVGPLIEAIGVKAVSASSTRRPARVAT